MNQYTFFWKDGKREVLQGENEAIALNQSGYTSGSLGALDFFSKGDDGSWRWDESKRNWVPTEGARNDNNN